MSQEAEYYVRNLSYGEARDLACRIAGQERATAERYAQQMIDREARRLEGRLRGEIAGLRNEVDRRQRHLQQQVDCNRRISEVLKARVDVQDNELAEHNRALAVLADHDRELQRQIEENHRFSTELAARHAETERRLQNEIAERRSERERQARSLAHQRQSAISLFESIPVARLHAVGLEGELTALRQSFDRAIAAANQHGNDQAALALLIEGQNKADALLIDLDRRETEIAMRRESARLALEAAGMRLTQLRADGDVASIFKQPLTVTEGRLKLAVSGMATLQKEVGLEFGRLLARWDACVDQNRALQDELEDLWNDRDRVLEQVRQRNRLIGSVVKSLMDVWGSDFELDTVYARTDDPRSTLMVQTKRPYGTNVTIHLELDGRMQVSFTGYVGMECAKDLDEFHQKLERVGDLKMEREALRNDPSKPNPPGVDSNTGPIVFQPANRSDATKTRARER